MDRDINITDAFLELFKESLIGKNAKGIVHNMNSPLQVLSMHIELLAMDIKAIQLQIEEEGLTSNAISQAGDRLRQIDEIISRINNLVKLVGDRVNQSENQQEDTPIILNQIINEIVEFWKSDLFFKHKVHLDLKLPEASPVILSKESLLKDALDGLFFSCIEKLKENETPALMVELNGESGGEIGIFLRPQGSRFSQEEIKDAMEQNHSETSLLTKRPASLGLILAKNKAKGLFATLLVEPEQLAIIFPPKD